tara:strand:+ start:143 stop:649 length:507 start_codon:yes stop_codon:yes gene_type:complete
VIVLEPDSPIESFQSPEAEHESAFVELQDMVKELFTTIEVTEVSIETDGTGGLVTSTLTLSVAVLPLPEQLILYVLVPGVVSVIATLPEVPIVLDQSPEALHEAALVEDHVRVNSLFISILLTLDDICAVGNEGAIISLLSEDPPLPPPPQETTKRAIRIELKNLIYD